MIDEPDYSADEFLDWLCWSWAHDGKRFYPPEETAKECMGALPDDSDEALSWEIGQHTRAYSEAVDKFETMDNWGFDPIERAAREQHELRQRAENYDDQIDWSWLLDRGDDDGE